jgi:hypothetical protein
MEIVERTVAATSMFGPNFSQAVGLRADVEYEEYPRGRVVYDNRMGRFVIMADSCILRRRDLVREISASMNLTGRKTDTSSDSHYRCFRCLHGEPDEDS